MKELVIFFTFCVSLIFGYDSYSYSPLYHYYRGDMLEIHSNRDKISKFEEKVLYLEQNTTGAINATRSELLEINKNLTKAKKELFSEIQIRKSHVTNLEKRTKKTEQTVQELHSKLMRMETRLNVEHSYCQSLPSTTCGPCLCFDDYRLPSKHYCDCQNLPAKRDCLDFHQAGVRVNGIYKINLNNLKLIQVYCDQTTEGGGWTVFQRRFDGDTDFYRSWNDYRDGFGTLQHEFWLGNEDLHYLTTQSLIPKGTELRIDMKTMETGKRSFAKYQHFQVYNSMLNYMLIVYGYSGTSGDNFSANNGKHFSTYDRDNDNHANQHCARNHHGGWWYSDCGDSNLNGLLEVSFKDSSDNSSIFWKKIGRLNFVEMKARRVI